MRVLIVRSALATGSAYYRVDEPVRAVSEGGTGIDLVVQQGLGTTMARHTGDGAPEVLEVDARGADVVVLQLPKTQAMLQCLRLLQAQGVAVVVEMDDLLSAVPYGANGHNMMVNGGMAQIGYACAREADFVTVSTPALLTEYAGHGRGAVVPNAVARRTAELPPAYAREPQEVVIGWTGTVAGHPYDLQEMGSGLQQALDRAGTAGRFVILGQKFDVRTRLGLRVEPEEVAWFPAVDDYLLRMGELFDIGIAPLRLDRFNESKSWLKPLEYAARGVYCVRARTAEYERLGLGVPARAPKDWAKWISVGVQDADRRREVAAAAREQVLASHLTEHTAERWVAAWRSALEHRARVRATDRRPLADVAG